MESLPISLTDLVVAGVVLISGLLAFVRGFFREVLSIGSWVAAFFAALYLYGHVAPFIRSYLGWGDIADLAAGVIVFIAAIIVLAMFAHYVSAALQASSLTAVDRSLGFLFGVARGAVLVCLAYLVLSWAIEDRSYPKWVSEARTLPLVERGAEMLVRLVPSHLRPKLRSATDAASQSAKEKAERLLLEHLMNPPAKSDAPKEEGGYTAEQRRGLERTIQGAQ